MKKILILSLVLAFLFPVSVPAQTVSSVQAEELRQTLITLLTEMIAQLQAQIDELLAKQVVNPVVANPQLTPEQILGVASMFGTPVCLENNVRLPINGPITDTTFSWTTYESQNNLPQVDSGRVAVSTKRAGSDQYLTLQKWNDDYTIQYSSESRNGSEQVTVSCE